MRLFLFFAIFSVVAAAQGAPSATPSPASAITTATPLPSSGYPAHRVYDTKRKRIIDFEAMVAQLAKADLVFLGEQHNDPRTHQLEAAVVEGIARRHPGPITLALEMFERDVQGPLDAYLTGSLAEADFLAASRPWPNYPTDYRPMLEFAKANGWPVVAGNVPRRLASVVARRGLAAVDSLPPADRAFVARDLACPRDAYWERFRGVMGDMGGHGMSLTPAQVEATVWRTYEAQCIKDETMGEAVAAAHTARGALVIHANGAFHSDYRLGTVDRARRRAPGARTMVVSFVPVADLDTVNGRPLRKIGDYIVFTLAAPE